MKNYKHRPLLILSMLLFLASLMIRLQIRNLNNVDIIYHFEPWYNFLLKNGWAGLADENFSNYPPAYLYTLWLSTLIGPKTGMLTALKIFPLLFDLFATFIVFLIARIQYKSEDKSYFIAAIYFSLPTIVFNSAGWGQIDGYFTSFLILCIYFLLKEKPLQTMIAFGFAFSVKAQAVFLLPFLSIMLLKGKIRWYYFLLPFIVYIALAIPIVITGRSWISILSIYPGQVGQFYKLSANAPNLYIFIPNDYYFTVVPIGLAIFSISMGIWGWINWKSNAPLTNKKIMLMALTSLALVPFLLPKMHDRYFYPADAFSLLAVIFAPEVWFLPILYQISSGLAYSRIFFEPIVLTKIGAVVNTFSILIILTKHFQSLQESSKSD